jgi:hypothetical protein
MPRDTPFAALHLSRSRRAGVDGGRQRVLMVELRGAFVVWPFSSPPGVKAQPVSGTYLHVLLDAATGEPLDFGVYNRAAHIAGDVVTLVDR